jgi:hypothetical protein
MTDKVTYKFESGRLLHFNKKAYIEVNSLRGGFVLAIEQKDAEKFPAKVVLIPDERIVEAMSLMKIEDKMHEVPE